MSATGRSVTRIFAGAAAICLLTAHNISRAQEQAVTVWTPAEIRLAAEKDHAWSSFPAAVDFRHAGSGRQIRFEAFWDGGRRWVVRYALPLAGTWTWESISSDPGLSARRGQIEVRAASSEQLIANPNYRGQLMIGPNQRHFTYADGTRCLLLADTLWSGNTARCGLSQANDGPFFQHLRDRREKGFTAVLMKYLNGFDDQVDLPTGERNEGGYPFHDPAYESLNPDYFRALDKRMQAIWDHGFVACVPVAWWGKTSKARFNLEQAKTISAYCAVRYGAFNSLWCLSGEYQYTFKDCGWSPADLDALGDTVQRHNPLGHPLSIHPSGRVNWPPPHDVQSSRPFHESAWLDHHWLQTGQSVDRMFNIVGRSAENRALAPPRPVFCSEAYYDRHDDREQAYHARWQVWTALLSGCAGYGYGAQGLWQFYDPTDERGETGKKVNAYFPWQQALAFSGSQMMRPARTLLETLAWERIEPRRELVLVDGRPSPQPGPKDLTPPTCATIDNHTWLVYIPRNNADRTLSIAVTPAGEVRAVWFDPRTGARVQIEPPRRTGGVLKIPARPAPAEEDWVFLLQTARS